MPDDHELLKEQQEYYRVRAPEYDDWFFRRGRYDLGLERNGQWFREVEVVRQALDEFAPCGHNLELASGTGLWTAELLRHADRITALDGSSEVHSLNRKRVGGDPRVEYVEADIFEWVPDRAYDVVFFSFWLSHVPEGHFEAFWQRIRPALGQGGRVFFIDSLGNSSRGPPTRGLPDADEPVAIRKLNDGREFRVVKIFYRPEALERRLGVLGWQAVVNRTNDFFLYGTAEPKW